MRALLVVVVALLWTPSQALLRPCMLQAPRVALRALPLAVGSRARAPPAGSRGVSMAAEAGAEAPGPEDLRASLGTVAARVRAAAEGSGRAADDVRLVAVSKTKPASMILALYEAGHRAFGENYAQELMEKASQLPADISWHFIGHLQSNKAKALLEAVPNLAVLETVDSAKLATRLNTVLEGMAEAGGERGPLAVYLQVDTSGEDTKSGVDPAGAPALAAHVASSCPRLRLAGLMTIGAPGDADCFGRLAECRAAVAAELGWEEARLELSMGMSGDFEAGIAAGSTSVRVGSSIFGARAYPAARK